MLTDRKMQVTTLSSMGVGWYSSRCNSSTLRREIVETCDPLLNAAVVGAVEDQGGMSMAACLPMATLVAKLGRVL